MDQTPKKWYLSKTLWFNIISGIVALLALPEFISLITEDALPYIALITALGNMILRGITTAPLKS